MIHRFREGLENLGNLAVLGHQDHHFSQEYQEDPKRNRDKNKENTENS